MARKEKAAQHLSLYGHQNRTDHRRHDRVADHETEAEVTLGVSEHQSGTSREILGPDQFGTLSEDDLSQSLSVVMVQIKL